MSTDETVTFRPMSLSPLGARPLVSVQVTCYNYGRFLAATLDALRTQTYDHFEALICDDGSTDDSVAIAQSYVDRDPRFRLFRKANGGQNSAVNATVGLLSGDIVCLLDADDLFVPDKIAKVVAAFVADPSIGACHHAARVVDEHGQMLVERLNPRLEGGWLAAAAAARGGCAFVPSTSCMSYRREVLAALTPIPAGPRNDTDGFLGMAVQFLTPVHIIDETLTDYRIHGTNVGGLTDPTPERLRFELRIIEERTAALRTFLADRFGPALATGIRAADNPQFIQAALKLRAVDPGHSDAGDSPVGALIARHPNPRWRLVWRLIFAAPAPVTRRAVPIMHRSHRVKAFLHRFMGRGQAVAT